MNEVENKMELFVYKGEFNLPSIDFDCLRVLTYLKLADLSVKVNYSANPFKSGNGFLPYLIDGKKKFCGYEKIVNHLRKGKGYSLIESSPQLSYLSENLYPFFMYQLWGNPQNVDDTRSIYAQRTTFPFNFYYPGKYIAKTSEVCQVKANFSVDDPIDQHDTTEMDFKARKCLNWIGEKLGTNEFFLEGIPSEVDATIYAYLAIILKYQLPNNQLHAHAKQCENLVRYVNNITRKFYKEAELFESPKAKAHNKKQEQKTFTGQEDEDPPSVVRKRYILSGLFATTVMISYAFFAGIFSIALVDKPNDVPYFEDNEMQADDE